MLENVLEFLTSREAGALAVVVWAVSWGFEEFEWWHELKSQVRALIILGVAITIAILATALQNNPALVEAIDPYFTPVFYTAMAWVALQVAHRGGQALKRAGDSEGSINVRTQAPKDSDSRTQVSVSSQQDAEE